MTGVVKKDVMVSGNNYRIRDAKAESLEVAGQYRRAASRWRILMKEHSGADLDWIVRKINACMAKSRRPPAQKDNFGGISRAASELQEKMGISQPSGIAFRLRNATTHGKKRDGGGSCDP